jgi:type IV pilus assembly PilN-like protein
VLRTNLSTRPFYNERAVHFVLGAVAAVVALLTLVNVFNVIQLSRQNTELSSRVNRDRNEADRLTRDAARIRRGINQEELELVVNAARQANSLIDQRTFSWTALFNRIEETLPPDVMLTMMQPITDDGSTKISFTVLARRPVDADEFMEKLEATGAFENVLQRRDEGIEGGMTRVVVDADYTPANAEEPAEAPADSKKAVKATTGAAPHQTAGGRR